MIDRRTRSRAHPLFAAAAVWLVVVLGCGPNEVLPVEPLLPTVHAPGHNLALCLGRRELDRGRDATLRAGRLTITGALTEAALPTEEEAEERFDVVPCLDFATRALLLTDDVGDEWSIGIGADGWSPHDDVRIVPTFDFEPYARAVLDVHVVAGDPYWFALHVDGELVFVGESTRDASSAPLPRGASASFEETATATEEPPCPLRYDDLVFRAAETVRVERRRRASVLVGDVRYVLANVHGTRLLPRDCNEDAPIFVPALAWMMWRD